MSLFSPKKESECTLVFDIGSGSVGGALVLTSTEHPPSILYSFRSDILFQEEATGPRLLSLMLRSLSQVVLALAHEGFDVAGFGSHRPHIREAFVSLSAPWVLSKTSFLKLRNEKPIRITPEIFSTLLLHASKDRDGSNALPAGSVKIEQKLIKSVLNGYETGAPYGKETSEAEFAVFGSFSVPRVTEKVSDTVTHLIHPKHVSFHSFSLLVFALLRELYPEESDFMIADISGEQTELSIAKRGVLVETATFPFGRNHIIRILQRSAHIPPSGIPGFFRLRAEGKGTGRLFERSEKLLEKALGEWRDALSNALAMFSERFFLPQTLFLAADEDVSSLFSEAVKKGDFSTFTLSPSSFRTVCLTNESLDALATWSPSLVRDPFISLTAACANRLRERR